MQKDECFLFRSQTITGYATMYQALLSLKVFR